MKAKAAGVYRGRKPSVDAAKVQALRAEGVSQARGRTGTLQATGGP
jgi:hypothetical protein